MEISRRQLILNVLNAAADQGKELTENEMMFVLHVCGVQHLTDIKDLRERVDMELRSTEMQIERLHIDLELAHNRARSFRVMSQRFQDVLKLQDFDLAEG